MYEFEISSSSMFLLQVHNNKNQDIIWSMLDIFFGCILYPLSRRMDLLCTPQLYFTYTHMIMFRGAIKFARPVIRTYLRVWVALV